MTGRQAKVQIELQQNNNEYLAKHGLRDIFSLLVTDGTCHSTSMQSETALTQCSRV